MLLSLLLSGCGLELGYPDYKKAPSEESEADTLRIFVTQNTTAGLIGSGGVAAADAKCAIDPNKPSSGTYRALIVDGSSRIAKAGDQADWVLNANTTYVRPDNTVIGTTNSSGLFIFPLKASIGTTSLPAWVGIGSNGETGAHCTRWTLGNSGSSANLGSPLAVTESSIFGATGSCDSLFRLYCVEQ